MNLRDQQYICALAQTGSITAAARLLNISQPTLSVFVSNLEDSLQVKLFDRIGKRFVPTYAGELYIDAAKRMLEIEDTFNATISSIVAHQRGRVRVGIQYFRSSRIVPNIYSDFTKAYPHVSLEVVELNLGELSQKLHDNTIDLFFCNTPVKQKDWEYITIFQDQMMFLTSQDHPEALKSGGSAGNYSWVNLKAFEDDQFILLAPGSSLRSYSDQVLAANHIKPAKTMSLHKIETIMDMISRGFGVGFCPESYQRYISLKTPLRMFNVGVSPMPIDFSVVYQRGRSMPVYTQHLIQMIKDVMHTT